MAENILHDFYEQLPNGVAVIPGSKGVFEISLGDHTIFSKKQLGRFPNENEVEGKLEELFGA